MATNTDLGINIKVNTGDSQKNINLLSKEFDDFRTKTDDINKSFRNISTDSFSKKVFEGLKSVNEKFGDGVKKVEDFRTSIESFNTRIGNGASILGHFSQRANVFGAVFGEVNTNLLRIFQPLNNVINGVSHLHRNTSLLLSVTNHLNPSLNNTTNNLSSLSNANIQANQNINNTVNSFDKAKIAILALSGSLVLLGKNLSNTASDFDEQMRNVNSIAQESEETYKKLFSSVRKVSEDAKITDGPTNLAKGMYQLVSSGFDASTSLKLVANDAKAAAAGLTDTETAVRGVSALMNGYNKKTIQDNIDLNDQMFKVVDKGVVSYENLANNIGDVIPIAASAKVPFPTLGAMIIEMTRSGISMAETATASASIIKSISAPTPEQTAWAKHLGMDLSELSLKTKGFEGVMKDLGKASGGSSALMEKLIGDSRAVKAAFALTKDEGKGLTRALGEMAQYKGSTDKAAEQQAKADAFAYKKLKSSLEDLRIEYGDLLNKAITPLLAYLQTFINYLKNLDQGTKETIVNAGLFTMALAALLIAIQGIIFACKGLGLVWGLLNTQVVLLNNSFIAFRATLGGILGVAGGVIGFFWGIDEAVKALDSSTSVLGMTLHDTLDTINLFGKVKNYFKAVEAENQNKVEEKDKKTVVDNFNNNYSKFKRKESSGASITPDEWKEQMKMLTEYQTFAIEEGGKTRDILVRDERKKIAKKLETFAEEDKIREENKKKDGIAAAEFGKKQEALFEKQKKLAQELAEKKKALANEVKSINEKEIDDLASAQKEGYEHSIFLAEKELRHRTKTFDDAKKLGVLSEKESLIEKAKANEVFHAQLMRMNKDLSKSLTDEYNQATLNKFNFAKYNIDKEFNERVKFLSALKKLGINTSKEEMQNKTVHESAIKKLNDDKKLNDEQDIATVREKWLSANDMIASMNEKMNLIGKSDSEKRKIVFDKEIEHQRITIDKFISEMSKQKNDDGKALYSKESIEKMKKSLEKSFENFKEGGNLEIISKDDFENYSKRIALIDDKLKELSENPIYKNNIDFTPVNVINKEIEQYQERIKLAKDFIKNTKGLTDDEIKAKEREIINEENKIKNSEEKKKQIKIKALKDFTNVFKELGIFDNKNLDFMSDLIGKTDSLNKSLEAITKGHKGEDGTITTGLEGIMNFAKDGGDISGITAVFGQIVDKSKQMIASVTDNIRAVKDSKDLGEVLGDIATQFGDVVGNMITLGLYSGIRKAIGIKAPKEIFEEQKKIQESDLKMNKDKEDVAFKTYNLQKELAFRSIKDESERTQKIKELDFDLNNSLFALHKENGDLDIQLENNKLVSIQKSYDLEKETIEQSEGNWQTRAKKLEVLFQQTKEKFAEQMSDIAKMDAKLNSGNEVEKMIKEAQADMMKINASKLDATEKERQQVSSIQDLAIKLNDIKKQGWKDLETLMSSYYDKEAKLVKAKHKGDYDEIQIREQSIKSNQKQIDKMQSELDKIEAKFAKLLDNKTLSKAAKTEFDKRVLDMQLQEGGTNYNQLIRTPETEFNRKIAAKKEDINAQYEIDGNLQAKSDALKNLAVEQNVYWNAISKNIVQGTKEYDESVKNQYNSFKEFKDAVKDGIDAQKDFEETNFKTTDGVIDLKKEITNLTDKNKQFTSEINNYNNQIQSDLDILTSKFKNSAGEWETDLNKVTVVLSNLTEGAKLAINELDNLRAKHIQVDNAVKEIIKDPNKAVTADNINTSGFNNLPGSKIESNVNQKASSYTDYSMPLTYNQPVNIPKYNQPIQTINDNYSNYQNSYAQVNDSNVPNGTVLYDSQNQNAGDFFNGIGQAGQSIFDGALGGVTDLFDNIGNGINAGVKGIGDFFNGIGSFLGFANGGISDGPNDGYLTKLHGREAVINENQGDNLAYIIRQANNPNSFINNTSSSYGGNTIRGFLPKATKSIVW